jgi:AcrR family transcriptional regulator
MAERWAEHRLRLIHAAADAFAAGERLTVDTVRARAGAGRNTVYAHFPDIDQLLRAVQSAAVSAVTKRVAVALESARTPMEALRGLARAWLETVDAEPTLMNALIHDAVRVDALFEDQLRRTLAPARRDGVISQPLDESRIGLAAGVLEAGVRRYLRRRSGRDELVSLLVDVVLRAFR